MFSRWFPTLLSPGLNDKLEPGRWAYTNGEPVSFLNWKFNKPRIRKLPHKKNCVVAKKRGKWRNKHCNKIKERYICEAPPSRDLSQSGRQRRRKKGNSRRTKRQKFSRRRHSSNDGFFYGSSWTISSKWNWRQNVLINNTTYAGSYNKQYIIVKKRTIKTISKSMDDLRTSSQSHLYWLFICEVLANCMNKNLE